MDFLISVSHVSEDGEYLVIDSSNLDERLEDILGAVSDSIQNLDLISQILDWATKDEIANRGLMTLAANDPVRSKSLVAALNYGRYSKVLDNLKQMVEADLLEREYQTFLEEHYWIFGSEYSELLDKRNLVLGDQLDFPLRRTVDGYLDVIEIKTALKGEFPLLADSSHSSHYMRNELSKAIGQVESYLARLEAEQHRILVKNKLKVEKVRGKIVIGRDGNEEQMEALRRTNASLNNIQIITFDQLIRIGERILDIMAEENPLIPKSGKVQEPHSPKIRDMNDIPF